MSAPWGIWDMQFPLRSLYSLCVEPVCKGFGVTRTELDILLFLANNPRHDTAAEIAEVRHLAKSHVSTSLKSLEASGYVAKFPGEDDRRMVRLKLTQRADAVVAEGRRCQREFFEIVTGGLSEEDHRRLRGYFSCMEQNIKQYLEVRAK